MLSVTASQSLTLSGFTVGGLLHRPANSEFNAGLFVFSGHVTMQGMTIRNMQQGIDIGASGSVDLENFDSIFHFHFFPA